MCRLIVDHTRRVIFLEDGDIAEITATSIYITRADGSAVVRAVQSLAWDPVSIERALQTLHAQRNPRAAAGAD
jgi:glucosamine 6-phosphate synthetase-like amidotransferase/phosphosugar isomerase protein